MNIRPFLAAKITLVLTFLMIASVFLLLQRNVYADEFKTVLFLNSYNAGHQSFSDKLEGLRSVFENENIILDMEFLDSKRLPTDENYGNFYQMLKYRIDNNNPYDAIVVSDDNALRFAIEYQKELFEGIPIVFLGVNNLAFAIDAGKDPWITGVVEAVSIKGVVDIAYKLNPKAKKVIALTDQTTTGLANMELYYEAANDFESLSFDELNLGYYTFEAYEYELSQIDNDVIVIYIAAFWDSSGEFRSFEETVISIEQNCPVPVYQISDVGIGNGITGGYVVDFVEQGKQAALMVMNILSGIPAEAIPVLDESPNVYKFDYKMIEKYGIDIKFIPEEAIILNREITVFEEYRVVILLTFLILVVQVGIIINLMVNIKNRKSAESKLISRNIEVLSVYSELVMAKEELEKLNMDLENRVEERTKDLENTMSELYKKDRLASLGGLVAGVAHEINTPLGVAVTAGSFLNDQNTKAYNDMKEGRFTKNDLIDYMKTVDETSEIIHSNLQRAAKLVKSFKDVAVGQSSEIKSVFNLKEYVDSAILTLKHEYKNTNHEIHVNIDRNMLIESYPSGFSQIITNLVMNSLIHGFADTDSGNITIRASKDENSLEFIYEDDGKGIAPEHLKKIFDPFFTTNRKEGGSGLGMNIVYNIVTDQLDGEITCTSNEGLGSVFVIKIPLNTDREGEIQ